jgi:hypothetical protein
LRRLKVIGPAYWNPILFLCPSAKADTEENRKGDTKMAFIVHEKYK